MQNALWQSGSDSGWFLNKKIEKNLNGTRDPLLNGKSHEKLQLFWTTSLIKTEKKGNGQN